MSLEDMEKYAAEHKDNIELRSEKVRNMIGQVPPLIIRWGNTVLVVIFVVLLAVYLALF